MLKQELEKYKDIEIPEIKEGLMGLKYYKPDTKKGEDENNLLPNPSIRLNRAIARFQRDNDIDGMDNTMEQINDRLAEMVNDNENRTDEERNTNTAQKSISDNGIDLLKQLEGDVKINGRHVIYDDATGLPVEQNQPLPPGATIGYGHLIREGEDFSNGLNEEEATELFRQDLRATYEIIEQQISADVLSSMSQNQYDALVSLTFNIGPGSASPRNRDRGLYQSTIRRYLNNESGYTNPSYPTMESAWRAFRNGGVLDRRRDAEWRLYENADYSGYR